MKNVPAHISAGRVTDLGGGFLLVKRPDGPAATIVVSALHDTRAWGMMSAASLDARRDCDVRSWLESWGVSPQAIVRRVNQVHGAHLVRALDIGPSQSVDADGVWTQQPGQALVVVSADCAPVWIAARERQAVALLHAGWRGVAAGIIANAVATLASAGESPPSLRVAIGPHLRPCCFEVGPEVASQFAGYAGALRRPETLSAPRRRDDSFALDLAAVIASQAAAQGVPRSEITAATTCTLCGGDVLHSYRRNGVGGPLMAACAMVQA
ncbi:MAG: polyphenol oxidase family protein [Candidatus Eremiobacteraeota bacterium]|nr:polyphenol oxidase family protein [Candidatus Eremiobacteraeota bacterium]